MTSLFAVLFLAVSAEVPRPAYTADLVVLYEGATTRSRVASDGLVTRTESSDGKTGTFHDEARQVMWVYGPGYPCTEVPLANAEAKAMTHEETIGSEVVDGHPTKKIKVTTKMPTGSFVEIQWRASDLHDLVLKRASEDGKTQSHFEHLVLHKPEAKLVAFPSTVCKASPASVAASPHDGGGTAPATAHPSESQRQAAGGERVIRFSEDACRQIVPLPISMSIPSDYSIRTVPQLGCFWGEASDLDRLLVNGREADFSAIQRGVFWCRVSENTEWDPATHHFFSEIGTDDQWGRAFEKSGATKPVMTRKTIGIFPSLSLTAKAGDKRVYMFYLAIPNTDSLAILINYHPAGNGTAADDATWKRFVDSVHAAAK